MRHETVEQMRKQTASAILETRARIRTSVCNIQEYADTFDYEYNDFDPIEYEAQNLLDLCAKIRAYRKERDLLRSLNTNV